MFYNRKICSVVPQQSVFRHLPFLMYVTHPDLSVQGRIFMISDEMKFGFTGKGEEDGVELPKDVHMLVEWAASDRWKSVPRSVK